MKDKGPVSVTSGFKGGPGALCGCFSAAPERRRREPETQATGERQMRPHSMLSADTEPSRWAVYCTEVLFSVNHLVLPRLLLMVTASLTSLREREN